MTKRYNRVGILGAGIQGSCIALELARRGLEVDLIDRADLPMTQASFWNEGKIHLGLIYAADPSQRTAATMLAGALCFAEYLEQWGVQVKDCLSEPFNYLVHRDSLLTPDEVYAHFLEVEKQFRTASSHLNQTYLGLSQERIFSFLPEKQSGRLYNVDAVLAAFRTTERSVDPQVIAQRIRAAVKASPRIRFLGGEQVNHVENEGAVFAVTTAREEAPEAVRRYSTVVNALWDDRARVDTGLGMMPDRPLMLRYKLAIHLRMKTPPRISPPSTTMMLGPFGDVVNLQDGRFYLSWYPVCRFISHNGLEPPPWQEHVTDALKQEVARQTIEHLSEIVPSVASLGPVTDLAMVNGGAVVSWGDTDVDDIHSEVHNRYDVGVHSIGNYHSVDTGKYSLAPYFAMQAADRIAPQ